MAPASTQVRTSLWQRKLDLLYFVFFLIHIPIMLSVDLAPYYSTNLRPAYTVSIREWYLKTYRDRFFSDPPAWFHSYMVLEVLYHIPVSLWTIRALIKDDPMIPIQLLIFATETGVTTLTCVVEMFSWEGYSREEQGRLAGLYIPYLGLAVLMGSDMVLRLRDVVLRADALGNEKKVR